VVVNQIAATLAASHSHVAASDFHREFHRDQQDGTPVSATIRSCHHRYLNQLATQILGGNQHRPGLFHKCLEAWGRWVSNRLARLTASAIQHRGQATKEKDESQGGD
tara:strand:- start:485 stop:805 length:321 start_codon:yes stop_codon:yes gene_type:complete